jgi:hypothetical protein
MDGSIRWYRSRKEALGHRVRIIVPQHVKPFAKHQKNDRNDAAAICRASRQPHMKFVPGKMLEQQDISASPGTSAPCEPSNGPGVAHARIAAGSRQCVRAVDHSSTP